MRIDSAQLTNASISGSFSGSITSTAEQPIVSGSSQVVLSATTGFGTYSASVATYTDAKVADLVDSSPGALDTLNELAAALGDDSNFSASLATSVGNRLPTATFTAYSSSAAGAVRTEYVAAVSTLSGSAHTQRVAISASLDATIDALDSLGISTDTERGALSGSAHAQRVIEKNIAAGLVTSLTNGAVASNTTTADAALPKAGGAMTGAITTNSTFDGRDVATDGTKLDAIEASADVTDETNVTAAGALMDTEVTNLAQVKAFASSDYATAAQGSTADSAQQPPSEGAFADGDKTKLDAIEASADVTDATNVTAAGALMDSEVTNLADVKAFDTTDYATAAQGTLAASAQQPPSEGAFANGDKTKLDAIEASADVTDATNVAANLPSGTVSGSAAQAQTQIGVDTALALKANLADPALSGNPTAPTQAANNNSTRIATTAYVQTELTDLIGGAPGTLDTLNELAAAINDDASYASTLTTALGTKAPKADPTFSGTIAIPNISDIETAITANTAKATNVSTNLSATTAADQITINSSDGDNVVIGEATGFIAGLLSNVDHDKLAAIESGATADQTDAEIRAAVEAASDSNVFTDNDHTKLNGIEASATADQTASEIRTLIGSGNDGHVPVAGTAGHFLKHDGTFGLPSYTTNTDTNDDVSIANLKTRLAGGFAGNAVTIGDSNDVVTIGGSLVSTGDITAFSDESLKKDVSTIEGALDKTKALRGVEFTRIADDSKSIGVIAQELEKVLPELVKTGDDGIKSVNYAQITGLLIEAVKELSAKVDELSK